MLGTTRHALVAIKGGPWELYDAEVDRAELRDLASQHPDIVARLAQAWEEWSLRCWVDRKGKRP
jgi:arylsulfatase